ncbi:isotrichodermin C-15 hydroxylase [Biscogniauxia mediterranea]|nr:isotrichodermin C-15 hydroxylase [Biscogniauxia mediterranea]
MLASSSLTTALPTPWVSFPLAAITAVFLYAILRVVYNVFFHPLRRFPGPRLMAASRLPYALSKLRGDPTRSVKPLHDKYGPVVRTAPGQLSFITSQAWVDIYGPKQSDMRGNIPKAPSMYRKRNGNAASLATAGDEDHRRLRRITAPAFSDKAIAQQEEYLQQYTSAFVARLRALSSLSSSSSPPHVVDVVHWLNLLTTDIIGELAFGENFGGLQNGAVHPWLRSVFASIKTITLVAELRRAFPWVAQLLLGPALRWRVRGAREQLVGFADEAVRRRLAMGADTQRPDLMSYMLPHRGRDISDDEIREAAVGLIVAGSETTATLLAGALYLLCRHPHVLAEAQRALRAEFRDPADLRLRALQHCEYLHAVVQESFRLYPPAPDGLVRRTTRRGAVVAGEAIPPHTYLAVNLWAAGRSETNFHRPGEFVPERWLKSCPPEFADDDRAVLKPFSMGPRDCVGKNLAWAEIRIVLANILWHFDMELLPESEGWMDGQRLFFLWEKPPLHIKFVPRKWE